jgi:glutathione S-transferase
MKHKTPFGQLPVLELNGRVLTHSNSIARFLGNELGLSESDNWHAAQLDALVDGMQDVYGALLGVITEKDAERAVSLLRQVRRRSIKPKLLIYESFLQNSKSGFFGSEKVSWADFVLFCNFGGLAEWAHVHLKHFPAISTFCATMEALPAVARWMATHRDVPYGLVAPPRAHRRSLGSPSA